MTEGDPQTPIPEEPKRSTPDSRLATRRNLTIARNAVIGVGIALTAGFALEFCREKGIDKEFVAATEKTKKKVAERKLNQSDVNSCGRFCEDDVYICKQKVTACLLGLLEPTAGINSATPEASEKEDNKYHPDF